MKLDTYTFSTTYLKGIGKTRFSILFNDSGNTALLNDDELEALVEAVEQAKKNRGLTVMPELLDKSNFDVHPSRTKTYAEAQLNKVNCKVPPQAKEAVKKHKEQLQKGSALELRIKEIEASLDQITHYLLLSRKEREEDPFQKGIGEIKEGQKSLNRCRLECRNQGATSLQRRNP